MKKKTITVRKLKPQVKLFLFLFVIISVGVWFWFNFGHLLIKKDMKVKKTQIQLQYEKELKEQTGENKAKKIAQIFASDYFTWRNKPRKGTIGGINYVDSDIIDGFRQEVYANYYSYFTEIRDTYGNDKLPQVSKTEILALRDVDKLPYTSRVLYNPEKSPKNLVAVDIKIYYDENTKDESRYHHNATVYLKKIKGDYKVVKLVSK